MCIYLSCNLPGTMSTCSCVFPPSQLSHPWNIAPCSHRTPWILFGTRVRSQTAPRKGKRKGWTCREERRMRLCRKAPFVLMFGRRHSFRAYDVRRVTFNCGLWFPSLSRSLNNDQSWRSTSGVGRGKKDKEFGWFLCCYNISRRAKLVNKLLLVATWLSHFTRSLKLLVVPMNPIKPLIIVTKFRR